ncbi:MAG: filamentous hemagglutinin N-terminal domain-containing protein [Cyanobacteria bacterium J06634_6]
MQPSALAQNTQVPNVQSDHTTGTAVSGSSTFHITEGTVRSGNSGTATLFHSFETFSPQNSTTVFDLRDSQNNVNTSAISAIVARVTGSSPSVINGLLWIQQDNNTPTPDLFLLNPQGVFFGEGASLNLPGSFVASTAESILFGNQASFSAVAGQAAPLLTVSAPTGLQLGDAAAGITLQGTGHGFASPNPAFVQYSDAGASNSLSIAAGEQISLIGGSIALEGGVINAPNGRIELSSVSSGSIFWTDAGTDYSAVEQFGDIELSGRSLISTSGSHPDTIQMRGRQIRLADGSMVLSQNRGMQNAGKISVVATESLLLTGATPWVSALSSIVSETTASGNAGAIEVSAPLLSVEAGAMLGSRTFNDGSSGYIDILAEQATVSGYVPVAPTVFSFVGTTNAADGAGSDISVMSQNLSVTEGGYLGTSSLGSKPGGNVTITADTVDVRGLTPAFIASNIGAAAAGEYGNSGNITMQTRTLRLRENGLVSTSSINIGDAGDIFIEASERIDISGGLTIPGLPTSTIASTVDRPPEGLRLLLGLSGIAKGKAGNVTLSTQALNLSESSTVTVANLIDGDAGQLQIEADTLSLRDAGIEAFNTTGRGGNIDLDIRELILLREGARVNAIALGSGNGGNLTMNAPVIVGLENSDITAGAIQGDGGTINITTQGLFGLRAQTQPTDRSDIIASSQFGLDGTISVNGLAISPDADLVELSDETTDSSTQIVNGCSASQINQFIASGRGGLPVSPSVNVMASSLWTDLRPTIGQGILNQNAPDQGPYERRVQVDENHPLVEASYWHQDSQGQVTLISQSDGIEGISARTATNCLAERSTMP